MKIVQPSEIPTGPCLLLCRQGRWSGTLGRIAMSLFLLALGPLWWHWGEHWLWLVLWFGVVALLVPTLLGGIVTLWRKSNWILRSDGLHVWVNLRSFRNAHFLEVETVVCLDVGEIDQARVYRERYTTPGSPGQSTAVKSRVESIDLVIADDQTDAVADAIQEERRRRPPPKSCLGLCKVTSFAKDYPISVPEPGVIRITWRGRGDHVAPRAAVVVEQLTGRLTVDQSVERRWPNWKKLTEDELDELIKTLARSGDTISAAKLLSRRRGISLTEAKRQVEEIVNG